MRIVLSPGFGPAATVERFPSDGEDEVLAVPLKPTYEETIAQLPDGGKPDLFVFRHLETYPAPVGLEEADCPVAGVIGDWNLGGQAIQLIAPAFDLLLIDQNGCRVLRHLGFENARYAALWGYKPDIHRRLPDVERDLDVVMIGNLNPWIQRERARWIARVAQLSPRYQVVLVEGVTGEDHTRLLNRAKIVFNHSIRGEMNARAFEAPAAGALMFYELGNDEVGQFLVDGEECVLYDDDNLEELLDYYLSHDAERQRIAEAGWRKVQGRSYPNDVVARIVAAAKAGLAEQPVSRRSDFRALPAADRRLRYCDQWLTGMAWPEPLERILREISAERPTDPGVGTRLACLLTLSPGDRSQQREKALAVAREVFARDPDNVLAIVNLVRLETQAGDAEQRLLHAAEVLQSGAPLPGLADPHVRYPGWAPFDVELEKAWYRHRRGSAGWTEELRSLLLWSVLEALSDLAYFTGRPDVALARAQAATAVRPDMGTTHFRLGRCLQAVGRLEEAAAEYREALRDTPLSRDVWLGLLGVLRQLRWYTEFDHTLQAARNIATACPPYAKWHTDLDDAARACAAERSNVIPQRPPTGDMARLWHAPPLPPQRERAGVREALAAAERESQPATGAAAHG
jgi:tetratricopeptide (TPR) repeat protein